MKGGNNKWLAARWLVSRAASWKGSLENMMFLHQKSSQEKEDKKMSSHV